MNTAAGLFPSRGRWLLAAGLCLGLAACHHTATANAGGPGARIHTYTVSGEVRGLHHGVLVLQNNGGDTVAIYRDGHFRFPTRLATGSGYRATIAAQPRGEPRQRCVLGRRDGVIHGDVRDLRVFCERQPWRRVSRVDPKFR